MVRAPPPNYPPPSTGMSIFLQAPHRLLECSVATFLRGCVTAVVSNDIQHVTHAGFRFK
jgi:hypothetical protein